MNPDLSASEGQGSASGPRCLQVVGTNRSIAMNKKGQRWRGGIENCRNSGALRQIQVLTPTNSTSVDSEVKAEAPLTGEKNSEVKQSEEEKQQPTEEEIKVNLRKKVGAVLV